MTEQTLSDPTPDANPSPTSVFGTPGVSELPSYDALTIEELMNQTRLVERVSHICLRGDLFAEYALAVEELSGLVDSEGLLLSDGDQALSDASRAAELGARIQDLRTEMAKATRTVRFRGMPDDEWRLFEKEHRGPDGKLLDAQDYNDRLIARCAIEPKMTLDQVKAARSKLGPVQVTKLANDAYYACTTGGLDVPKSPAFLAPHLPQASSQN